MPTVTEEMIGRDVLPALKEHGAPSGFTNDKALGELIRRLEEAPTYMDRARLNDELVALQNGEVPGATQEQQRLAFSMSLLWGMSVGAYYEELEKLEMPDLDTID